jgi:putative hemolysin
LLAIVIVVVLILIALNGFLAMAEIAVVTSRRVRLQQRAERGDKGAVAAIALASEPNRFLSTVQIGITLVGILAGAFGGAQIATRVDPWLQDAGISPRWSYELAFAIVVVFLTYLSLIFGELIPKRIGLHSPEVIAGFVSRPMRLLSRVAAPFVAILSGSMSLILRLVGLGTTEDTTLSEEEIRLMIGMSAESGTVAEEEAELLDRVFHFGDRRVHEVMVPRTEVVWLPIESKMSDFYAVFAETPHSRFPVFEGSPDKVVGIIGIKDVLAAVANGWLKEDSPMAPLVRPAHFAPESKPIGELFREMQSRGIQMAVAVDEFGGTAGIVTLEMLLEEMVGPMFDEVRPAEVEIQTIDENTIDVDGGLSVVEAREELGLEIPEGPYDTIAGFMLSELGHIPQEGEHLVLDHQRITVVEMKGPKIELLRVTKVPE